MLVFIYTPQSDCVDSVWIVLMKNDEQLEKCGEASQRLKLAGGVCMFMWGIENGMLIVHICQYYHGPFCYHLWAYVLTFEKYTHKN